MTDEKTNSGMDRVKFEGCMADRAVWAAATMRKANQRCADRGGRLAASGDNCRGDDAWRFWNGCRAGAAAKLLAVRKAMRDEGYAFPGEKTIGDFLAKTYREMLRYERAVGLSERSARCAAEVAAALEATRAHGERAVGVNPFAGMREALERAYEGVDRRRLICLYVADEDLQGLDLPEAFALAPAVWRHYLDGTGAA